jgi:hypothetical protein
MTSIGRLEWTLVAGYIRRHIPGFRMKPNELAWYHEKAGEAFSRALMRGATYHLAGECARAEVLLLFVQGTRP